MDECERETRIRAHLSLVKRIARRIHRLVPSVDLDDLIGDGSIGLIRAVDNFDSSRGPTLEQYARHVIVGSILNGIRRMDPVSERARRALRDGEAERYRIALERGSIPSIGEMERLRPGFERASAAAHCGVPLSIDAPLPEGERLPKDWAGDPAEILNAKEELRRLHGVLDALPERQSRLLRAHYFANQSLRDIGERMNISPQRASQIHLAALTKLRKVAHAAAR